MSLFRLRRLLQAPIYRIDAPPVITLISGVSSIGRSLSRYSVLSMIGISYLLYIVSKLYMQRTAPKSLGEIKQQDSQHTGSQYRALRILSPNWC